MARYHLTKASADKIVSHQPTTPTPTPNRQPALYPGPIPAGPLPVAMLTRPSRPGYPDMPALSTATAAVERTMGSGSDSRRSSFSRLSGPLVTA